VKIQKFNLERFIKVHSENYLIALNEIRNGQKNGHWMWYVFPQLRGLGKSYNSEYYGIEGIEETRAYLAEPILRSHLLEISEALLNVTGKSIDEIFDCIDKMKLRSSMTLFAKADPNSEIYLAILDKYFDGKFDDKTIGLLNLQNI
jgi:uncharacterized protein (DUF1810 family)